MQVAPLVLVFLVLLVPTGTHCTGTHWYPLLPSGTSGNSLVPVGTRWYLLVPVGTRWYSLVRTSTYWWLMRLIFLMTLMLLMTLKWKVNWFLISLFSRSESEIEKPRDRDREVKYEKNSPEFSRNETLAGCWSRVGKTTLFQSSSQNSYIISPKVFICHSGFGTCATGTSPSPYFVT